jgi:anti-sigma28 factor (negative regulator of flagellin synthesis)
MDIPRDLRPTDDLVRKRVQDATVSRTSISAKAPANQANAGFAADQASFGDAGTIERYVSVLKTMNPVSLHKVEDLRVRIANGTYSADPEELADLILADRREPATGRRLV